MTSAMSRLSTTLVLCSLAASASAQYPYYRRRHSLAGGAIAGIVIAIFFGILLLSMMACMGRRRRRGQAMLPGPGGFTRVTRFGGPGAQPGYTNGLGPQGAAPGGAYHAPAAPPPYPGKEAYPGQPASANGAPQPGGFAPPPGPPLPAHINDGNAGRFGWFKGSG